MSVIKAFTIYKKRKKKKEKEDEDEERKKEKKKKFSSKSFIEAYRKKKLCQKILNHILLKSSIDISSTFN